MTPNAPSMLLEHHVYEGFTDLLVPLLIRAPYYVSIGVGLCCALSATVKNPFTWLYYNYGASWLVMSEQYRKPQGKALIYNTYT